MMTDRAEVAEEIAQAILAAVCDDHETLCRISGVGEACTCTGAAEVAARIAREIGDRQ